MAESDLERRLRSALAQPSEPGASPERLASVRRALPARRTRRRLAVSGAAALVALAVVLGAVVERGSGPSTRVAAPGKSTAGPSCVEIDVGSAAPRCVGAVAPGAAAPSAASAASAPRAAPSYGALARPLVIAPGRPVVVSLPPLSGIAWSAVVVTAENGSAPATRRIVVQRAANGRRTADVGRLAPGAYQFAATGRCSTARSCAAGVLGWSAALTVR